MAMASCQPKIPGIEYKDEGWWREFFTKDLTEFYSSLKGLLNAREALLKELSGDLAQILANPNKRDLALKVLFGGIGEDCIKRGVAKRDCIPPNSAAGFHRYVLGIGLKDGIDADINETFGLILTLRSISSGNIGSTSINKMIGEHKYEPGIPDTLNNMYKLVDGIYGKLKQVIPAPKPTDYDYRDLTKAFEDFLNKSIKLLPLYNPFTFFMQSLRSTPKPYLKVMYCDELFSDSVMNLMSKYGVELTKILDPSFDVPNLNDELAVIGHRDGSVGDLLVKLVWSIYELTYKLSLLKLYEEGDELKKYVNQYRNHLETAFNKAKDLMSVEVRLSSCHAVSVKCEGGLVIVPSYWRYDILSFSECCPDLKFLENKFYYDRFLEVFSPLLFLGVAWISKTDQGVTMYILH
jgi:hypothetical protein